MYLALYRKWRPQRFSDVVSQEHITTTLRNQVTSGKTAHAYLFTGSRGTGKTTCAKILSKAVNCLHPVDGNPCLECDVCRGIEDGSIIDVIEMDAASNNGVDDIRDLRDAANFAPTVCRKRVYIIDEVHMLSVSAFNALLKIMEEPPEHLLFILATTEVHKVPQTILSRCQQYDFRRIRPEDIVSRLLEVTRNEDFTLTDDAAMLIARLADGGMRDALSLLDQCVAYSTKVTAQTVVEAAGIARGDHLFALTEAAADEDAAAAIRLIDELYESAKGIDQLVSEWLSHMRNLMICKASAHPEGLVVCPPDELDRYRALAERLPLPRILSIMSVLQQTADQLSRSGSKRIELEMAAVRLCCPDAFTAPAQPQPAAKPKPAAAPKTPAPAPTAPSAEAAPAVKADPDAILATPLDCWQELLAELAQSAPPLFSMLQGSQAYTEGNVLIIDSPNPLLKQLLLTDNIGAGLADAVEQKLGKRYRLRIAKAAPKPVEQNSALEDIIKKASAAQVELDIQ